MAIKTFGNDLSKTIVHRERSEFVPYSERNIDLCLKDFDTHISTAKRLNYYNIFMLNSFVMYACARDLTYSKGIKHFNNRFDWARKCTIAASKEAYEAEIEDSSWAWWKPGSKNIDKIKMEVVDIFHFIVQAVFILNDKKLNEYVPKAFIATDWSKIKPSGLSLDPACSFDNLINNLIELRLMLMHGNFDDPIELDTVNAIIADVFHTWLEVAHEYFDSKEEFLEMFIVKARRNIERQLDGYHSDLSKKSIDGKEDNIVLIDKINKK